MAAIYTAPDATLWPSATTTGVPAGTVLTPHKGDLATTQDYQIIDAVDVQGGGILIRHNHVMVTRCRIKAPSGAVSPIGIRVMDGKVGTQVTRCEIDMNMCEAGTGIGYANYVIQGCNIHGAMKSVQIGDSVMVFDCWIHDPYIGGSSHTEPVGIFGSETPTHSVIRHNRMENLHSQTAVVFIKTDQGPVQDVIVDHNWLEGGNYTVYSVVGYWDHKTPPTGVQFTSNVFGRGFVYGPRNYEGLVAWSGNRWDDGSPL